MDSTIPAAGPRTHELTEPKTSPRARRWADAVPVYPALFAAAFVLSLYVDSWAGPTALGRPLIVAVVLAVVLQAILSVVFRDQHTGAFFASILWLTVAFPPAALVLVAVPVARLAYRSARARRFVALDWGALTGPLNLVSVILVAIVLFSAISKGSLTVPPGHPPVAAAAGLAPNADTPDIYLLLLDAYPRSDTLATDFGYDNSPFIDSMHALGFELSADSHSNYPMTSLTLASMLNHAHIHDLVPDPPSSAPAQFRRLSQLIDHGAALDDMRRLGYEIVSIPSQVTEVGIHTADRYLDSGELTVFESSLIDQGLVPRVIQGAEERWLAAQDRDRIEDTFERVAALADEHAARPRFVLAHVMAPHPPIVFAEDGSPVLSCFGNCSISDDVDRPGAAAEVNATAGQVNHVNRLALDAVGHIVAANKRPAVVIVFSDHGYRLDPLDKEEVISNLFLARTPDRPTLFPNDTTLVNVLPRILNSYAGANLPMADEASYWTNLRTSGTRGVLDLERVR